VAQLYLRALGSLFVASYDSHDYGGGILTLLHTEDEVTEFIFSIHLTLPTALWPWDRLST
jgi:hypothetical protein